MEIDKWAHLRGLVEFVLATRKPRYRQLAESERGLRRLRAHLTNELERDLDPRFAHPVLHQEVKAQLDLHAAPAECYVISTFPAIHDTFLRTVDALAEASELGRASLLFFVPGRLAFYRSELSSMRLLVSTGRQSETAAGRDTTGGRRPS